MSYATLMVYLNVDRVSKQLIGVAAKLAEKFSAKLIGVSALGIRPPVAAEGFVIVDNASEFDIAQMKAKLADAENKFRTTAGAGLQIEWRAALELPTDTLIGEARCADLILLERSRSSEDMYRVANAGAAILGAGRPILVVPAAVKSLQAAHVDRRRCVHNAGRGLAQACARPRRIWRRRSQIRAKRDALFAIAQRSSS
jgi:hypothetical protein